MKKQDKIYLWGIAVEIVSLIILSRNYTLLALIAFAIGFAMILAGYVK